MFESALDPSSGGVQRVCWILTSYSSNPQAISMAISIAVKSLNTMHHDSMSVNFVRFVHTFPFPHNAT